MNMSSYIIAVFLFAFLFLLMVIVGASRELKGNKSQPVKVSGSEIILISSSSLTKLQIVGNLLPLILGISFLPIQLHDLAEYHYPIAVFAGWSLAFFSLYVLLPIGLSALLMSVLSRPQELHLNKQDQTYSLHFGTCLRPKSRSGSWSDIAGICVRPIRGKYGQTIRYGVYIAWRHGLSGGPYLGSSKWQDQAEWLAKKFATETGLHAEKLPEN